ncbi:Vacuolar sorting-associated protein 62 [Quillaja saponaria]|uniref:Vacuolar sorting-associated protein 62 n=1 Tax=Quillaja saponaria TaxID=32244 RepID=A0AAD7KZZ1_QUISA|nr:Vacuolar sorting-associated protein 62 [Quillaja saponaria]
MGQLWRVYFSQHSKGEWLEASELEFQNGNKPVAYSSLHGHALYPKPGLVLQGNGGIGIRNDTAKSDMVMDTGVRFEVVAGEYLSSAISEPAWLNFFRKWGPRIDYSLNDEIKKVEKLLPGNLNTTFEKFVDGLPDEILGEEGPTGPKLKNNWSGDDCLST